MESEAAVLSELSNNSNKQMCLVEEPSQEVDQKVPEIQEDKATNEDETDQNMETIDLLKASQSLTSSIKEDFSQLKEEVFKVFKERDTSPSSEAEHSPATSVLNLLKEDLSQLKEDVSSIFSSSKETKSMDPQTSQPTEKTTNRLSFLNFKDDLSSIFRIGLSKERDNRDATAKPESSNTFKTKAKRTDKPFLQTLFRRDQNISQKTENIQEVKNTFSETSDEQMDSGFRGNLSEQSEETGDTQKINNNMKDRMNEVEDKEVDTTVSDETTRNSETQQTEETIPTQQAAEQGCKSEELSDNSSVVSAEDERINKEEEQEQEEEQAKEEVEEQAEEEVEEQEQAEEEVEEQEQEEVEEQEQEEVEEKEEDEEEVEEQEQEELQLNPSETLLWKPLSSGINLFNLRNPNIDNMRDQLGRDLWSVKNFACYLTLDPNTANSELHLTDCNRMATRVWSNHRPSGHLDRFERCPQVLCREGLLDSVYWEVEWSVGADIGVTYNSISRDGDTASCLLGHNEQSWSLECSEGNYTPCHQNKRFRSSSPQPFTHRVGVYLNWPAGSLSFYSVSHDTMVHLHTFTSTFTEPLYPGFWVWAYQGSVSLRQVELDWERLLQ